MNSKHQYLAEKLAIEFSKLPQVVSVALSGSSAHSVDITDSDSDIDLYVYVNDEIPIEIREAIVENTGGASLKNIGLEYWGPGDEWIDKPTNIEVDIIYFEKNWIESELDKVIIRNESNMGYTTCFWSIVRSSIILFDPTNWFSKLQQITVCQYPDELRKNIVVKNYPLLKDIIPSYINQIKKAVKRSDLLSINHRTAAFYASYFDIIFSVNRILHPGEKRLLEFSEKNCKSLPKNMRQDIESVLQFKKEEILNLSKNFEILMEHFDNWLISEGFLDLIKK